MKERNILAGFKTVEAAEKAAASLRQAGFETIQIAQIGQYPGDGIQNITNPITGDIPSLASLTEAGDFPSGRDASILAAAGPDASGMADRGDERLGSILLTAVVPEERGDEATQIIEAHGGVI
ncbi:hypothetical protein NDK47_27365 [Brevibacillus ruminantium]|uniref:General stress protein 17M-like domain-containing protein n=1 Tax=Brevibacillus ruminantium TaxID=2950604 RepID=A0ABY4WF61_9BACL|nr:hypothetical protein [Brevibacillus ruminantium]USG65772.1 hypothetical protein NDK47_27365 [Brevibacillus ruminantium]